MTKKLAPRHGFNDKPAEHTDFGVMRAACRVKR